MKLENAWDGRGKRKGVIIVGEDRFGRIEWVLLDAIFASVRGSCGRITARIVAQAIFYMGPATNDSFNNNGGNRRGFEGKLGVFSVGER